MPMRPERDHLLASRPHVEYVVVPGDLARIEGQLAWMQRQLSEKISLAIVHKDLQDLKAAVATLSTEHSRPATSLLNFHSHDEMACHGGHVDRWPTLETAEPLQSPPRHQTLVRPQSQAKCAVQSRWARHLRMDDSPLAACTEDEGTNSTVHELPEGYMLDEFEEQFEEEFGDIGLPPCPSTPELDEEDNFEVPAVDLDDRGWTTYERKQKGRRSDLTAQPQRVLAAKVLEAQVRVAQRLQACFRGHRVRKH